MSELNSKNESDLYLSKKHWYFYIFVATCYLLEEKNNNNKVLSFDMNQRNKMKNCYKMMKVEDKRNVIKC